MASDFSYKSFYICLKKAVYYKNNKAREQKFKTIKRGNLRL